MNKPKRIVGKQKITIKKAAKPNYNIVKTTFYKNGKVIKRSSANAALIRNNRTSATSSAAASTRTVNNNPDSNIYRQGNSVSIRGSTSQNKGSVNPVQRKIAVSNSSSSTKRVLHKPVVSKQPVKLTTTAGVSFKMAIAAKRKAAKRILRAKAKKAVKSTAKKAGKTVAKTALVTTPKAVAKAKLKAKKKAAETMINQGLQSTGFGNDVSSSPNAQAAETFSRGFKDTSEHTVSTVRHAPKKFVQSVKKTSKNIRHLKKNAKGIQQAAKGMNQAVKNFQRAQHINSIVSKGTRQTTATTVKNIVRLTADLIKQSTLMLVRAAKTAIEVSAILGWIAIAVVTVIVVVIGVGAIIFSEYGIFMSKEESENSMTIQDVIKEVNADYQIKVEDKISDMDNASIDLIRYEGSRTQWKNIIAVYSVKYASDEGDVITVDSKTVKKVKSVFYKFHTISGYYTYEPNPYDSSKTWNILVIQTNTLSPEEVMKSYNFTEEQRKRVDEIITSQPDDLWNDLIYGTSGEDTAFFIEVVKQQLGQHRQLYTSWYGLSSNGSLKWDGCFVSWCANEAGFITKGYYPKFNDLNTGIEWFKSKGLWDNPWIMPNIGDTIFLDTNLDGTCDRCGIIEKIENGKIYYIFGYDNDVQNGTIYTSDPNHYIMGYGKLSLTP